MPRTRSGFEARKALSQEAMAPAVETRRLLEKSGIECPLLTGGSTGTYNIDSEIDGHHRAAARQLRVHGSRLQPHRRQGRRRVSRFPELADRA